MILLGHSFPRHIYPGRWLYLHKSSGVGTPLCHSVPLAPYNVTLGIRRPSGLSAHDNYNSNILRVKGGATDHSATDRESSRVQGVGAGMGFPCRQRKQQGAGRRGRDGVSMGKSS